MQFDNKRVHLPKIKIYRGKNMKILNEIESILKKAGFKPFNGQSMLDTNESIIHFINNKNEYIQIIYNPNLDKEDLKNIKGTV
jgi:hypothetical protein